MIALFLIPIFYGIPAFIYFMLLRWLKVCNHKLNNLGVKITVGAIFFLLTTNTYLSYLMPNYGIGRFCKQLSNYWFAVKFYGLLVCLVALIITAIVKAVRKKKGLPEVKQGLKVAFGAACILILAGVLTYGFINARVVRTTKYEVTVDKDGGAFEDLNVVLIADLHLGYNIGCSNMRDMVEAVNAQNPDIILVGGDIFDNDYDSLDDPEELISILKTMKAKYGVYAVYGNHDVSEKLLSGFTFNFKGIKELDDRMDAFVEACGWKHLIDEGVMIEDSVYIFGRPDYSKPGKGVTTRLTPEQITEGIDSSIPYILLEHQPVELNELSAAGVDVALAGHTHDGQFFPLNISNALTHDNGYGYKNKNGMHSIVTSGVGLYGPYIRVGTIAEITQITVHFTK